MYCYSSRCIIEGHAIFLKWYLGT